MDLHRITLYSTAPSMTGMVHVSLVTSEKPMELKEPITVFALLLSPSTMYLVKISKFLHLSVALLPEVVLLVLPMLTVNWEMKLKDHSKPEVLTA